MPRAAKHLLEEALELPEGDRAEIAARLIESLDPSTEDDASGAWADEVGRRLAEVDRGEAKTVPWTEGRRRILDDRDGPTQD